MAARKQSGPKRPRRPDPAGLRRLAALVVRKLTAEHPDARTALQHADPLQLLVATILSAQCTDERVNLVTPGLFARYRSAEDFARARPAELESEIRSTGFFRSKAKNIMRCAQVLVEHFGGRVPESMEELVRLPGVGRKTANVVLGSAFGKAEGIVADTHVLRVSRLLGLTTRTDAVKVESDLMGIVARKDWIAFSNLLILHGRRVCRARKPRCSECPLNEACPSASIGPA